jgi:hypothetical protein
LSAATHVPVDASQTTPDTVSPAMRRTEVPVATPILQPPSSGTIVRAMCADVPKVAHDPCREAGDGVAPPRRVVTCWSVSGGAGWTVLEVVTATVALLSALVVVLMLVLSVDEGWAVIQGRSKASLPGIGRGMLTLATCSVFVGAWFLVRRRRESIRRSAAEAAGPGAAFALACIAQPDALKEGTAERADAWLREFRRLSPDVLVVDLAADRAIGDPLPPPPAGAAVTIRGMPSAIGVALVAAAMAAFIAVSWSGARSLVEFGVAILLDVVLGAGAIALMLVRQRRIGGDRLVRAGRLQHGTCTWTSADSLLAIRTHRLGVVTFFNVLAIGPSGITFAWVVDGPSGRRTLRELAALWLSVPEDGVNPER